MNWSKHISEADLNQLSEKIKNTEKKTSAEIVSVIANKSSTTRHIKFTLFLLLSVVTLVLLYGFDFIYYIESSFYVTPVIYIFNVFISIILSKTFYIQRLLIPKCDRKFQVENMAELEFYKQRINMTRSKTGLLIYLSLMEKRAVVLCDKSIAKKFPKETWQEIVNTIITSIHNSNIASGLEKGIEECAQRLHEHFPVDADDINELPNSVILITNP